ncbi:MAG: hypothetical protein M3405_17400 [Acidobacteriota bacterium]|nr:hypothetical protein [Acidobacteriota bacterium]
MIAKNDLLRLKSNIFGMKIAKLCLHLGKERNEYNLSKLLVERWKLVQDDVTESIEAESKIDFVREIKVADQTLSDLDVAFNNLREKDLINELEADILHLDVKEFQELIKILVETEIS